MGCFQFIYIANACYLCPHSGKVIKKTFNRQHGIVQCQSFKTLYTNTHVCTCNGIFRCYTQLVHAEILQLSDIWNVWSKPCKIKYQLQLMYVSYVDARFNPFLCYLLILMCALWFKYTSWCCFVIFCNCHSVNKYILK